MNRLCACGKDHDRHETPCRPAVPRRLKGPVETWTDEDLRRSVEAEGRRIAHDEELT